MMNGIQLRSHQHFIQVSSISVWDSGVNRSNAEYRTAIPLSLRLTQLVDIGYATRVI